MRGIVLLAAILVGCTGPSALASASPSVTTTSVPTVSPTRSPTRLPGASVRVSVNGVDVQPGSVGLLSDDGPSTVVLTFPVAMDRASVERWLPQGLAPTWTDDSTLRLTVPASAPTPSFKVPDAMSMDGMTTIELFIVAIDHAPSAVVSVFTLADLLGGAQPPSASSVRVALGRGYASVPSPDGARLLTYFGGGSPLGTNAKVVDLATRKSTTIALPNAVGTLRVAGWAGNDIVFASDHVWLSGADGGPTREIADLSPIDRANGVAVSPGGSFVAVAGLAGLAIVDLKTGAVARANARGGLCGTGEGLAWSNDERRLAIIECPPDAKPTTRVIDVATRRDVATIDGGTYGIRAALNGSLLVSRDSGVTGAGAPNLWIEFTFDGVERAQHLARLPILSPDGRYLADPTCCAGEGFELRPVGSPAPGRVVRGSPYWLRDGRIFIVEH